MFYEVPLSKCPFSVFYRMYPQWSYSRWASLSLLSGQSFGDTADYNHHVLSLYFTCLYYKSHVLEQDQAHYVYTVSGGQVALEGNG